MLRRGGGRNSDRPHRPLREAGVAHPAPVPAQARPPARVGQRVLPEHADPPARGRLGERRVEQSARAPTGAPVSPLQADRCFELVGVLNGTVLVEDVAFEERGIQPAFFRVLVAWKEEARKEKAREEEAREEELAVLRSRGIEAGIEAAPSSLSTESPPTGRNTARRQKRRVRLQSDKQTAASP